MTGNPAAPILCCECGDAVVTRPGDRCDDCTSFHAEQPVWPDEPPSAYDKHRDHDEEARCHADD